ncbi:MAG: SDR family oxidoreductase [Phycisphaeraceae bacterium]|nr:SDR family oxidoreductase [Phycisphaeraceae bacterium]
MAFEIQNKNALISGANRGIGRAIAEAFLEKGAAKVYAAVRQPDSADELKQKYRDRVEAIEFDLARPEFFKAAAEKASDAHVVVNNAGVLKTASPLADDAIESLQFETERNVYGLIRMAQAFAPVLKHNGGGAFVQLNSVASYLSFPDFATYSASKAAAYSITQALRKLFEEQNTQVFSVHPGPIDTDMAQNAGLGDMAEPASLVAEAILAAFESGDFHVYPDSMAKQVGEAYASFADQVILGDMAEA